MASAHERELSALILKWISTPPTCQGIHIIITVSEKNAQKFIKTSYIHCRYTGRKQNLYAPNPYITSQPKIKLFNALPFYIKIYRNDAKGSKSAFKEYIHAQSFYCEREFTSIYKKCKRFLPAAAMYMRSALFYSTVRNITLECRTYVFLNQFMVVRDCGILLETGYINFEKCMFVMYV